MQNISILKVESPWSLWGRVHWDSEGQDEDFQVRMNLHYHDVSLASLEPCPVLEGQMCMLYWTVMQCWCRATVESVVLHGPVSTTTQVRCFLVDHGERVVVTPDQIWTLEPKFRCFPFQARQYSLAWVRPSTLQLSVCEEKALLIPSSQWDSSATRYLHNLLQASTQIEALLGEDTAEPRPMELYLTVQGVKICVNDDLVAKRFAFYCSEVTGRSDGLWETPAMLACDIFSNTHRFLASDGCSIRSGCTLDPPRASHDFQWGRPAAQASLEENTEHTLQMEGAPCEEGVLVHSALPVQPCSGLAQTPVTPQLLRVLVRRGFAGPDVCERYSWPAVAKGCDTIIISRSAARPLSYLPPLLSYLQQTLSSPSTHCGPIAVILCPGWEKAQSVAESLDELQANHSFRPITVLLGVAQDEAKTVKIPKNCLLLVTTPFSLQRLLCCHCFLFLRLAHLVLDQADLLFSLAPEQMESILQHFQKVTAGGSSRQILAVSRSWSDHMEGLLTNHMASPCVVITLPEEAALYAGVQQRMLMAMHCDLGSILLGGLDLNSPSGQKTLVVTQCAEEAEQVFQVLKSTSVLVLKAHQASTELLEASGREWRKKVDPGTQVVMVTTDACVRALGLRDATCVVHYGVPPSRRLYGLRLFSMEHNFRNLVDKWAPPTAPQSLLLVSEQCSRHGLGLLRYLRRTGASLPPQLLSFARGLVQAQEQTRTHRPLCTPLKSFGVCRTPSCPDRHRLHPDLDRPLLPVGVVMVLPLHIQTASVFHGRILSQSDDGLEKLLVSMASYYSQERPAPQQLEVGGLCALKEDQCYHRVRVLCEPERADGPFRLVWVRLVDEGREQEVKVHQLHELPAHFQVLPEQAVEMVLCRVRPTDSELTWNPEVTWVISQKVRGHQHQARVVLSLGNTVFLDPMVKVHQVPGVKTSINDHNVRRLLLDTGKGTGNPEHLELLKGLWLGGGPTDTNPILGPLGSPEERLKAAEEVLVSRSYPSHTGSPDQQKPDPESSEDRRTGLLSSLHPQVRWYQTTERVIITMKLMNPEEQRCDFYPDRLVYSGTVAGSRYRADLALCGTLDVASCSWTMKCNQPVLTLLKEPAMRWNHLLRHKNHLVSYDLEHWDEEEEKDATHCGFSFVEQTGEEYSYVLETSDSESD